MKILLIVSFLFLPVIATANTKIVNPLPPIEINVKCNKIILPPLDLRKRVIVENTTEIQLTPLQKERMDSPYIANSIYF